MNQATDKQSTQLKPTQGYFWCMDWVWDRVDLSLKARGVLTHLMRRADKEGYSYPSIDTISKCLGLSRSGVRRGITELIGRGYIVKKRLERSCKYKLLDKVFDVAYHKRRIKYLWGVEDKEQLRERRRRKREERINVRY